MKSSPVYNRAHPGHSGTAAAVAVAANDENDGCGASAAADGVAYAADGTTQAQVDAAAAPFVTLSEGMQRREADKSSAAMADGESAPAFRAPDGTLPQRDDAAAAVDSDGATAGRDPIGPGAIGSCGRTTADRDGTRCTPVPMMDASTLLLLLDGRTLLKITNEILQS